MAAFFAALTLSLGALFLALGLGLRLFLGFRGPRCRRGCHGRALRHLSRFSLRMRRLCMRRRWHGALAGAAGLLLTLGVGALDRLRALLRGFLLAASRLLTLQLGALLRFTLLPLLGCLGSLLALGLLGSLGLLQALRLLSSLPLLQALRVLLAPCFLLPQLLLALRVLLARCLLTGCLLTRRLLTAVLLTSLLLAHCFLVRGLQR